MITRNHIDICMWSSESHLSSRPVTPTYFYGTVLTVDWTSASQYALNAPCTSHFG